MQSLIEQLQQKVPLTEDQMTRAITTIMDSAASPDQIRQFLLAHTNKGLPTADELVGAAKVMREKAIGLKAPYGAVDCCGTGGDGANTYNISTAVAFVCAACEIPMAKHGNRSFSSKSGAADVLEVLGVNLGAPIQIVQEGLETLNFGFLMAPNHHPAMKHVAEIRKEIGKRTIFNLLGPLTNPACTRLQLVGVYAPEIMPLYAESLDRLGIKRAWIVNGKDGLDEITVTAPTRVTHIGAEKTESKIITPEDFGLQQWNISDLKGGDATENAQALRALLEGKKGAYRDIVLANAAAVITLRHDHNDLKAAVKQAAEAIDSGDASRVLKDYVVLSRSDINENAPT